MHFLCPLCGEVIREQGVEVEVGDDVWLDIEELAEAVIEVLKRKGYL